MNNQQRYVVIGAAIAVVAALLYPPFHINFPNGVSHNLGFGFLFDPPAYGASWDNSGRPGSVTIGLLMVEWLAIAGVAGLLWWLFKDRP